MQYPQLSALSASAMRSVRSLSASYFGDGFRARLVVIAKLPVAPKRSA